MKQLDTPPGLSRQVLDSLPIHIAVVDTTGTIVETNRAWEAFGGRNGLERNASSVGENYLDICEAAADEFADRAAVGIRSVLDGDRESFELEYPCHAPDEERWFRMTVTPFEEGGMRYGVVAHSDITERKRAEMAVEDAMTDLADEREQLALLNQLIRHDIRNDMNVLVGWAELLDDHVSEAGREYLSRVTKTGRHVIELTRTVGDLTELLANGGDPPLDSVDVCDVVRSEAEKVETVYDTGDQTVEVRGLDDLPAELDVLANEMLSSVVGNLLNNAVLHNDKSDAEIDVECAVTDETVTVCIADNGPGVRDEVKATIFERGEHALESGGQGLGLYLVTHLVDHYHGDVWVADNDPEGAVFCIELERA